MMSHRARAYTSDVCLFSYTDCWHLLLVRRQWPPFAGRWALPGGYLDDTESHQQAAVRELAEETGIELQPWEVSFVDTYGEEGRDPRGPTTSCAWWAVVDACPTPEPADDAADARWWPLADLPEPLAFDHSLIIAKATGRLCARNMATDPVDLWAPAEIAIPDLLTEIRWVDSLVTDDGTTVHEYQHTATGRRIYLDARGHAWSVATAGRGLMARPANLDSAREALQCL